MKQSFKVEGTRSIWRRHQIPSQPLADHRPKHCSKLEKTTNLSFHQSFIQWSPSACQASTAQGCSAVDLGWSHVQALH